MRIVVRLLGANVTSKAAGRESTSVLIGATAAFSYELVALWTDLPTISHICQEHPLLAGALIGALSIHFQPPRRKP